jgi:hypothetical protein
MRIGAAANDAGQVDLFAVGTAHNSLTHLFEQQIRTNWVAQTIEMPTGEVEEYISYSTDVTVYDAAGSPLVNTPVTIWSDEECRITVNGATYFAVPHRPARLSTNSAGILAIGQETGALSIPALQLNIPSLMPAGQSLVVEQSAGVQHYLAGVQGPALMEAKDAKGEYILPESRRTEAFTGHLALACNSCMALAEAPPTAASALLRRQGPRPGVWVRDAGSRRMPGRVPDSPAPQHWRLSFTESGITYQTLSAAEAQAIFTEKQAFAATEERSWWSDLGDFLAGVVDGFIKVKELVVTVFDTISDCVNAVFTFIVDGVERVFTALIRWIGEAFDLVEVIFAQIAVPFEKLFEWLGEVFDWKHILLTQQALAYTMTQMLDFLDGAADGIKTKVDAGITNLQGQVHTIFQEAIKKLPGTIGGYAEDNRPSDPRYGAALSNNIVFNGLIDNAGAATFDFARMQAVDPAPFQKFTQKATEFMDTTEATKAFADARTYFTNLGTRPDEIFTQLLAGLLSVAEALVHAVLDKVQAVVDALFDAAKTLVTAVKAMLTEEWIIPFVSPFYSWLTNGQPLTMLNLITLIVAAPATILYKVLYQTTNAPFPDTASVAAFRNSFNARTLLAAAGFGNAAERRAAANVREPVSPTAVGLIYLASGISTGVYGALTAFIDGWLPPPAPKPPMALLWSAVFFELAWQAFCCPWYTSKTIDWDCGANGGASWMWIYQWGSFIWDGCSVRFERKMPETDGWGVGLFCVYGVFHLALGMVASQDSSGWDYAANILPAFPEMAKPLRWSSYLWLLSGIDVIFYGTSAGITLWQAGKYGPHPHLPYPPGAAVAVA